MVLDEPQHNDERFQIDDLLFIIDRRLAAEAGPIKVDYQEQGACRGFSIRPAQYPTAAGSGYGRACYG